MASAKIADYVVLADGGTTLEAGENAAFSYSLPKGAKKNSAILSFRVSPRSDETDLQGEVLIGGQTYLEFGDLRIRAMRTMHEVVNLPDLEDEVQFIMTAGSGSVKFSDIVLWFQRKLSDVQV